MSLATLCPDPQALQQLLLGHVAAAEARPLGEHVLHCDRCAQTLHSLKAEDTLVAALRAGGAAGDDPESGVIQDLIHRLEGLRSSFASAQDSAVAPAAPSVALPTPEETISQVKSPRPSSSEGATEVVYGFLAPPQGPEELGRLGPYRVLKVLGAGGMGVVFQAEDTQLERMVALKAMLPSLASSPSARQRFVREAKAVAAIEHDHIVPIFQVGEDRGTPYLAMPLLKGEPLDERLKRENKLPVPTVLRIGREVAEGLAAAHERGLIHRDVKPGNIWLEGKRARVKILDFGLARVVAGTTHLTQSGAIVGTPAYMAPEQTRGGTVDYRADLFSLGCVLYRLATGELPFKGTDTMSILASLALDNPPPPRELDPNIPSALSDLVTQLLAKKPEDRPQTAQVVVERIQAIEQGQVEGSKAPKVMISAHPAVRPVESTASAPSGRSRTRPSGRRWVPIAVVVALGVLGAGGYLAGPAVYRVATNQGQLVIEVDDPGVEVVLGKQGVTVHDSVTDRRYTVQPGRQNLPAGTYEVEVTEAAGGMHFSTREFTITRNGQAAVKVTVDQSVAVGPAPPEQPAAAKAAPKPPPVVIQPEPLPDLPPGAPLNPTALVARPAEIKGVRSWTIEPRGHRGIVTTVAYSPDGRSLVSSSGDGVIRRWEVATGRLVRAFVSPSGLLCFAWSTDGTTLAGGCWDQTVRVWDAESGRLLRTLHSDKDTTIQSVAWSPDGKQLASAGGDCSVRLWDVASGQVVHTLKTAQSFAGVCSLAWSPDGKVLAAGSDDNLIRLWDPGSGKLLDVLEGHKGLVHALAWSPDGKVLASGSYDHTLRLWETGSGRVLRVLEGHRDAVYAVAWSPDGKTLASGSADNTVRLWEAASGRKLAILEGHVHIVASVQWSPDGTTLASGSWDTTVRLWQPGSGKTLRMFPGAGVSRGVIAAWSPDGKTLASGSWYAPVRLWAVESGRLSRTLPDSQGILLTWAPDGKSLATGAQGRDDAVCLWDPDSGLRRILQSPGGATSAAAWSPDGKTLATGSADGVVRLWDTQSGQILNTLQGHQKVGLGVLAVAWSPDGKTLASAGEDKTLRLWEAGSGKLLHTLEGHTEGVLSVAWSPDGKVVASGGKDRTVRVWDADSAKCVRTLQGHDDGVRTVAWSPDGKTLASAGGWDDIRLWEAGSGRLLRSLHGFSTPAASVAWSADGKVLATAAEETSIRLWEADTGKVQAVFMTTEPEDDQYVAVSPEGHYRATPEMERQLVYVVQTDQGQETLSPEEFQKKYGWKNDPDRVGLIGKR